MLLKQVYRFASDEMPSELTKSLVSYIYKHIYCNYTDTYCFVTSDKGITPPVWGEYSTSFLGQYCLNKFKYDICVGRDHFVHFPCKI